MQKTRTLPHSLFATKARVDSFCQQSQTIRTCFAQFQKLVSLSRLQLFRSLPLTACFELLDWTFSVSVSPCPRNPCADRDPCTEHRLQLPPLLRSHVIAMLPPSFQLVTVSAYMDLRKSTLDCLHGTAPLPVFSIRFYNSRLKVSVTSDHTQI